MHLDKGVILRHEVNAIVLEMFNNFEENVEDLDSLVEQAIQGLGMQDQEEFQMDDMVEIVNFINNMREQGVFEVEGDFTTQKEESKKRVKKVTKKSLDSNTFG